MAPYADINQMQRYNEFLAENPWASGQDAINHFQQNYGWTPDTSNTNWQKFVDDNFGGQASAIKETLNNIAVPNYDWTPALQMYLQQAGPDNGWQDPGRGASAGISAQIVTNAANTDPSMASLAQSVVPGLRGLQQQQGAAIQAEQATHGGEGLFGDLGPIAQLAALLPGPQQPFLLAANAANNLSQGNLIGAGLNAFGAYSGGWDGLGGSALGADTTAFEAGGAGGLQSWGGAAGTGGASGAGIGDFSSSFANSGTSPITNPNPFGNAVTNATGNTVDYSQFFGPAGETPWYETLMNSSPGGVNVGANVLDAVAPAVSGAATGMNGWNALLNGTTGSGVLSGGGGGAFGLGENFLTNLVNGNASIPSIPGASTLAQLFGGSGGSAGGAFGGSNNSLLGALLGGVLGSQNGAKQAGTTTTVSDIPDWLKPYATNLLNQGQGQVNANAVNPGTFAGSDATLNNIMNGGSIQAPTFNPYGGSTTPQTSNGYIGQNTAPTSNGYIGATTPQTSNSYIGATATPGTSQYLGMDNPYFQGVLDKALNDTQGRVNNQFRNSAFGGSANQELLARNLGDQANSMRYGEYGNQVQLSEADIARKLAAQQTDLARNSSLAQNQGQFNAGLTQADLARNSSLLQNQGQFNANLSQTDLARNASLQQNQGQFNANLYANDLTRNGNLWNSDATRNQNAYQFGQGQAFNAATNMPQYQANKTNAAFAPLQAQKGLFTSGTQTSTPYYTNPAAGLLGGALAGSQLFGGK